MIEHDEQDLSISSPPILSTIVYYLNDQRDGMIRLTGLTSAAGCTEGTGADARIRSGCDAAPAVGTMHVGADISAAVSYTRLSAERFQLLLRSPTCYIFGYRTISEHARER